MNKDKGIPHQQNVPKLGLIVAVLRTKSIADRDLEPLVEESIRAIGSVGPGTVARMLPKG